MTTYTDQASAVLSQITSRSSSANTQLTATLQIIEDVRTAITDAIDAVTALGLTITTSEATYVAPTASAPTAPTVPGMAISDPAWNAEWLQAQYLMDRTEVRRTWEASNAAAAAGFSQMAERQAVLAAEAGDEKDQRDNERAMKSAFDRAQALRQDTIQLYVQNIANFQAQWATKTESERVRLAYADLELRRDIEPAVAQAEFDLKATEIAQQNAVQELVDLVQVYAQITTALFAASDVGLSSTVSAQLSNNFNQNISGNCSADPACSPP